MGGYYQRCWFIAAEFGVDWAITTHIAHSQFYRDTVYADAKDGWYANTGGEFYYGLLGGYSFPSVDIIVRAGQRRDLAKARASFLPFYATVGVNVRFGDVE